MSHYEKLFEVAIPYFALNYDGLRILHGDAVANAILKVFKALCLKHFELYETTKPLTEDAAVDIVIDHQAGCLMHFFDGIGQKRYEALMSAAEQLDDSEW